ncbi:mechanosensitive ion channel family protein [Zoogloea dura]|uniref:Mechanosensitive ion channel n=1 Tax=Zoogloea dura TaxID=2728840 RepID=A0A848G0C8_9RHOO|nr:mechanosensitive ion channel family protein [Zoogloea dura]NML24712.1 mechanosensitive ion channel [Zoogloea dura]
MQIPYLSPEAPFAILLMLAGAALIFGPLRAWRRSLVNTGVFFIVCLAGDLLAGLLHGQLQPGVLRWLRELAVFGEGLAVIRYLGLALFNVVTPRMRVHISGILADILVIVGYVAWGFLRLNLAGMEFSHLFATSAVLTAVVAISMQDTLGNLLGGLALQMDNSLEIGDWIQMGDVAGRVSDIQWRYTAIVTRNGERVVIPNSHLMKNRYSVICNKRQSVPLQRRSISFNVDLSVPPSRVTTAVLQDVQTARIPNLSLVPPPQCLLMDFGQGFARYQLRYWLMDPGPDELTDSDVRHHLLAALQREGIRLAVSDQTIHLVQEGEAHREEVRARELNRRLQAISRIDLFSRLSEAEQLELAGRLVNAPFAEGDIVTRQGAIAHWLYIIVSGEAEAWWQPPDGSPQRLLERRGPGSVFGELGLMTGAPRRATVIAVSDVEAYRLDKAGFEHIIRARPEIAEGVTGILQQRMAHFQALEQGHANGQPAGNSSPPSDVAALGRKIREFFGL